MHFTATLILAVGGPALTAPILQLNAVDVAEARDSGEITEHRVLSLRFTDESGGGKMNDGLPKAVGKDSENCADYTEQPYHHVEVQLSDLRVAEEEDQSSALDHREETLARLDEDEFGIISPAGAVQHPNQAHKLSSRQRRGTIRGCGGEKKRKIKICVYSGPEEEENDDDDYWGY